MFFIKSLIAGVVMIGLTISINSLNLLWQAEIEVYLKYLYQ